VNLETKSFLGDSDLPREDMTLLTYLLARAPALHRGTTSLKTPDSRDVGSPVEVCPPVATALLSGKVV
jgi:hypothetical protein